MGYCSRYDQNFFWSARSEAYQDAFLLWLFRNYDIGGELGGFSAFFVDKLLCCDGSHIQSKNVSEVNSQRHDSDVSLVVETDHGKYLIIIEDKAGSSVHKSAKNNGGHYKTQLEKYYLKFAKDKEYRALFTASKVRLIYYKNEILTRTEEEQIKEWTKDKSLKDRWQIFNIKEIYNMFNEYLEIEGKHSFDNMILNEYYQNLKLWKTEFDVVTTQNDFDIKLKDKKKLALWNKQSWLWEVVFYRIADSVFKNGPQQEYKVGEYQGKYKEFSICAKNKTASMIVSAGSFHDGCYSILIQLRSSTYGDEIPWSDNDERNDYLEKLKGELKDKEVSGVVFRLAKSSNRKGYNNNKVGDFCFNRTNLTYLQLESDIKAVKEFFDKYIDT